MDMIGFKVFLFCFCDIKIKSRSSIGPVVEITSPEKILEWLNLNYENLNKFTDDNGLSIEINKEMSLKASSFVETIFKSIS